MKPLFTLLFGIALCFVTPCTAATTAKQASKSKKIYVQPEAIKITKDGIFFENQGQFVPAEKVSKDDYGIFVEKRFLGSCGRCGLRYDWDRFSQCPRCHLPN